MLKPGEKYGTPESDWDAVCDQCAGAYDQAEILLDQGDLAEVLRVLRGNEAGLRRLNLPTSAAPAASGDCPLRPDRAQSEVVPPAASSYAVWQARAARLRGLRGRTDDLLARCEPIQRQAAEELRHLRTSARFQPRMPGVGGWFSDEA